MRLTDFVCIAKQVNISSS